MSSLTFLRSYKVPKLFVLLLGLTPFVRSQITKINDLSTSGSEVITAGETIKLKCSADHPVTWIVPNNTIYRDYSDPTQDGRFNIHPLIQVGEDKYSIGMEIRDSIYTDTGRYRCQSLTDPKKGTEVFVFVQDDEPGHVFLHWTDDVGMYSHLIPLFVGKEGVIDCVSTHPDVSAKFYFKHEEVKELEQSYDPSTGFIVPANFRFDEFEFSAVANCHGQTPGGLVDELNFAILAIIPTPLNTQIDSSLAEYAYRGGNMTLICIAQQKDTARCSWVLPPAVDENRVTISEEADGAKLLTSLTVDYLEMSDSGTYNCSCEGALVPPVSATVDIEVSPTKGQITSLIQSAPFLTVKVGENVNLWVTFSAWPPDNLEIKWWHVYDCPILGRKNVSVVSDEMFLDPLLARMKRGAAKNQTETLTIRNLKAENSGKYFVDIKAADITMTLNFSLNVESPPAMPGLRLGNDQNYTKITNPRFLYLRSNYYVICTCVGFPLPSLDLQFMPCLENESGEQCKWKDMDPKPVLRMGTYQSALITNYIPSRSGTFSCIATDPVDTSNVVHAKLETVVSDVNDTHNEGMAILLIVKRSGIGGSTHDIYTNDGVRLSCRTQKVDYAGMEWHQMNGTEVGRKLADQLGGREGYGAKYYSTEYDNRLDLTFSKAEPQESGQYACLATLSKNPTPVLRFQNITVKPLIMPKVGNRSSPTRITANYTDDLSLRCFISGSPEPVIEWFKDGKKLEARSGTSLSRDKTVFNISRLIKEDGGVYVCEGKNRVGVVTRNITLTIANLVTPTKTLVSIVSSCLVLAVIFILILLTVVCVMKRKEKKRTAQLSQLYDQLMNYAHMGESNTAHKLDPNTPVNHQAENLPYDRRYEVPKECLELGEELGGGQFGKVLQATLSRVPDDKRTSRATIQSVAVKVPKDGRSLRDQKALLDELKIMIHIGSHENVLGLIGAITKHMVKGELYVIVELCHYGSLLDYLKKHRATFVSEIVPRSASQNSSPSSEGKRQIARDGYLMPNILNSAEADRTRYQAECDESWGVELNSSRHSSTILSTSDLLSFAAQAANGMDYLAAKHIIHRDLAARNLLLTNKQTVKIADFGLARQNEEYQIKGSKAVPLPIKWMALESIIDHNYTVKSDVWSFGIVMWELFSLGTSPYPTQSLDQSFIEYLIQGNRLMHPTHCPDEIYYLMRECWNEAPEVRPSFRECRNRIGEQLKHCSSQLYESLTEGPDWAVADDCGHDDSSSSGIDSPTGHVYVNQQYQNWPPDRLPSIDSTLNGSLISSPKNNFHDSKAPPVKMRFQPAKPPLGKFGSIENEGYMLQNLSDGLSDGYLTPKSLLDA